MKVGQKRPHHAPIACLGAIGHILARQEDASQVGAGRVRHGPRAAVPRVEEESRRGSAVVADGRRRQSRASQAGAVVVHEPFVPPAWPVFLLGSPVVERPYLARGVHVAELGEGPYVAAALRLAQAACDALGPFPCDVLGITQAPFPQVLGQAGEALPVLAHRPLGPRLLREVGHDLLCVAHVPVVHGRLSSLRGFPHCGRMTVRMLRAGAGTWPVARPKRADKIMRRIRHRSCPDSEKQARDLVEHTSRKRIPSGPSSRTPLPCAQTLLPRGAQRDFSIFFTKGRT